MVSRGEGRLKEGTNTMARFSAPNRTAGRGSEGMEKTRTRTRRGESLRVIRSADGLGLPVVDVDELLKFAHTTVRAHL